MAVIALNIARLDPDKDPCPMCGNMLNGKPPNICSPLRCGAWVVTDRYDHEKREWVKM